MSSKDNIPLDRDEVIFDTAGNTSTKTICGHCSIGEHHKCMGICNCNHK